MYHSHHIQHARLAEARAASPMLTEIDARPIAGHGGTVTLYLSASPAAPRFFVAVVSAEGEMIAGITAETPAEALDAYRHSFARPDVPDIFGRRAA